MKDAASYHILPLVPHNSETTKNTVEPENLMGIQIWRFGGQG